MLWIWWGLSGLHWVCRNGRGPHLEWTGTYYSSPGKAGISGLHSRLPRGRVATRLSWSPLSGLKGVQPPLPVGERTRDCSPGQNMGVGLPFPSPGDLPDPGITPRSPTLQADSLPSEPPGKHACRCNVVRRGLKACPPSPVL